MMHLAFKNNYSLISLIDLDISRKLDALSMLRVKLFDGFDLKWGINHHPDGFKVALERSELVDLIDRKRETI
jgi:hypothetical protein